MPDQKICMFNPYIQLKEHTHCIFGIIKRLAQEEEDKVTFYPFKPLAQNSFQFLKILVALPG